MIAVIGAGPAGLAAAWRLSRAGVEVVVLESASRVGGMTASLTVSGQRVDLGYQRLDPHMPTDLRRALDDLVELQEHPRRDRVRIRGRWAPHPVTAAGALRSRLLPGGAAAAERHLVAKYLGTDPADLLAPDADSDPGAGGSVPASDGLLASIGARPRSLYPRRGFGAVCEAMAELVPEVRLRTKVTGLIEHDDRVIVGLADGRIVTAEHVVSTVPARRTASWLGVVEPAQVQERALVLVFLTVAQRPYTTYGAHLLPDRAVLPVRISEPGNLRSSAADPPDRSVLCAEVPCSDGDGTWNASDADLGARLADDLVRVGLPDPRVRAVDVVRLPSVHPVMTSAARDAAARAERALRTSSRVTVVARERWPLRDAVHLELAAGFAAADRLRSGAGA